VLSVLFPSHDPRGEFVKTRNRNEALDLRVYAYSALCILNVNLNAVADRIVNENPAEKKPKAPRPIRKKQSFVNSWR